LKAEIITIGDELLIGQVVDTNSAFLATELNKLGIAVVQITSIPDIRENILKAFDDAAGRADLVVATGGLGPTSDDITKSTLAEYFGSNMVVVPSVLDSIRNMLEARGMTMNERNIRQAELPDNCELLHNSAGSAQGMWFKKDDKDYISLPGVPFEMKAIFSEEMKPRFKQRFNLTAIQHITILTHGIPESEMANMIQDWEESLPENLKLAYLPSPGILRLRITGKASTDLVSLSTLMENEAEKLKAIIGKYIFGYNDDKLEIIIGNLLKSNNLSLSLAESCTGGLISSIITSVPGASAYYKGGIVAYSNEIKTSELNVSPYTLLMNGAVSQAVVEQMADGARTGFKSDFSVAVSGISGPTGGTDEKPVGTTWIAVASKKRTISRTYNFGEDRGRNIQKAAIAALFMLRKEIMDCL
jgi:nicotinamide-nucleotide amidase